MKLLYSFFRLPFNDKKLVIHSLSLIIAVRVGLWVLPFVVLDRWLTGVTSGKDEATDWPVIQRIVRSVRASSRFVPYATCLTQALVTRVLLKMYGQPADLRIGVEKDRNEKFGAHAWIEVHGRIVIGRVPQHHRLAVLS